MPYVVTGELFRIGMTSHEYRESHYKEKVVRPYQCQALWLIEDKFLYYLFAIPLSYLLIGGYIPFFPMCCWKRA